MANSGERDQLTTIDTFCGRDMDDDSPCPWAGEADVRIDSEDWADFTCGNGHLNTFKWDPDTC